MWQAPLSALVLLAAGSVVIALPDDGRRLLSLSRDHGPSALDAVGIVLVLVGWVVLVTYGWQRKRRVIARLGALRVALALGAVAAGLALTAWSVAGDNGAWWVVGVAIAAAPQAALLAAAR